MADTKKCCGECKFHMFGEDWFCNNPDSDNYTCETDYEDTCIDYEEKD